ncbi:MAG: hypothetical protein LBH59_09055, partial [Planctomycetaceae bacterium]|nr:hypothetical protein [Planctomycetaceae bacterium]
TRISAAVGDYTEIWQVYVNASKSIGIEFMGNDSSPTVGEVNITGAKTISLSDLIHSSNKVNINVTGNNVTGDDKHILSISDAARSKTGAIDAKLVNLQAAGNIGDVTENGNSLRLLGGNYRTVVDAEAQNINIDFRDGKVFVNNVKTTGGEESVLKFRSAGEIYMDKDSNSGFNAAGYLDITADGGKIVKENNPNAVDPNAINFGYFTMTAGNNVRIQSSGDMKIDFTSTLYADSIVSQGGNIDLNVNGNLLDRNPIEEVDPLSDAERSALWSSLGIISGEQENIDRKNTIISGYERLRTNEYFEIWNSIHNAETNEFDLSKYDSDYVFKFTNSQVEDMLKQGTTIENIQKEENNKTAFYHQTLGNGSGQFNENYRYSATDEEKTQMTTGLNWTKKQLQNSIPANLLIQTADAGTRQNTTSMMEEPNISGFNVTINVAGNIGTNTSDNITINSINDLFPEKGHYTNNDEFEEAQENAKKRLRALADAELDDVEVIKDNNGKIISLSIKRYDNLNISATESLKLQANTGWINVGSQDDIKIDNSMPDNGIIAGKNGEQELRLKTDGSIEALNNSNVAIYAKNAILEAANGKIGTNNNLESLIVNLTGNDLNNGWITARANEGIYITFGKSNNDNDTNNAYIREISSQGNIYLKAADFIDALSNSNSAVKIGGIDIILVATHGSIGTQDKWFAIIQKENGSINLSAKNDIYVNHPNGSFNIVGLNANGNVQVKALIDLIVSGTVDVNYNDNTETILTAETGVFKIINETVNTHQKPFTAIAKTDLLIENVINLIAGTTILTAETGNIALTGKDATLDNAIITALEGDIEWNIDNMTITANNDNTEGNALNIHANKNIFSGGTTTVDHGNVKWIADNGSISDIRDQNGSINLDAKNSEVILTAKNGIGTNNSLELSAETLNANVSEIGNISLNLMSDSKLNGIKTNNGIIDINSIGNVTIAQIIVGGTGNDFVLGANNITFVQNSNVKADNRIVIVSQNGNIYSQATNDNNAAIFETGKNGLINLVSFTGSIYGEKSIVLDGANKNVGFLAELNTGKINLVAGNDVFIYDISNATFDFGTIAAQNRVALMFATERNLTIDKIIANKIDVHQNQIKFSELTDQYSANITSIIGNNIDKIMSNNNTLFANTINIKVNETTINNNKKGAELEINDIKIKSQTNLAVVVDRLTIDQIIAGSDSSLTHYGGSRENGGVAEMTLVNDIISTGNFTFKNIKSKEVYAYSNSVNGSVRVINSYSPYRANYDINNISLVIDATDKNHSQYYSHFNRTNKYPDFRVWSLDGTYDFNLSREQLYFNNPNMLTLSAMNHNIILNGNVTYTDSAFDDLLTEYNHALGNSLDKLLLYSDKIIVNQIGNTLNSQQVNISPTPTTINFVDIFNNDSPIITPILDNNDDNEDEEEKLKEATTENNNTDEPITITQHKYMLKPF